PGVNVLVLGPLEVMNNGVDVRLGGPKQRTVLALLAAEGGKPVSVDTLIDGVWGDEPTAGARSTLQTYVSNLRAAIGDVIVRADGRYRLLHAAAVRLDPQGGDRGRYRPRRWRLSARGRSSGGGRRRVRTGGRACGRTRGGRSCRGSATAPCRARALAGPSVRGCARLLRAGARGAASGGAAPPCCRDTGRGGPRARGPRAADRGAGGALRGVPHRSEE